MEDENDDSIEEFLDLTEEEDTEARKPFFGGKNPQKDSGFLANEDPKSTGIIELKEKGFHELHDKLVEVKQAVPKEGNTGSQGRGFGGYGSNHGGGNYGRMDNNMYKNATAGDRRGYTGYGPTGYAAPAPMQGNFAAGGYMNGGLRESKALWAWDIVSDNCGIYKSSIMELYV
ncbi:glycine-rich RNA-binding protein 10-like [Cryptomeria japonica]|uniref:glycine-rich RNA-binding protein 10-like n=1 Tax=Cryptomeria japonica TaxID=3369 RepID=UPI0027D9E52B|nr:glycine-rich RNA-binding protein 10-like [Cryptomeria japonica]